MKARRRVAAVAVCFVALIATPVAAQEFRATITGNVSDQQGALVPGASIEARTGARRSYGTRILTDATEKARISP